MKNIKYLLFIVIILVINSCMTTKKAVSYLENHNKLATVCDSKFPITVKDSTTSFDSTGYIKTIDSVKSINEFYEALFNNLNDNYDSTNTDSISKNCENKITVLKNIIVNKNKQIKELNTAIVDVKPIYIKTELTKIDSAGKQALRERIITLEEDNSILIKKSVEQDNKIAKKNKELWIYRISLFLLILYFGIKTVLKLKSKVVNPLA